MTPLHIEIAMHYHCRADQHPMLHNEVHRRYAEDLKEAGMLIPVDGLGVTFGYARTDGLRVWIEAICATPLPVQRWVIPEREIAEA